MYLPAIVGGLAITLKHFTNMLLGRTKITMQYPEEKSGEIPSTDRFAKVEKYPEEFDIDMIRCIFCGMCEEVCPEQAIFLRKDYAITGFTRADMVHHKEKLLEIGGVMHGVVLKWNEKK